MVDKKTLESSKQPDDESPETKPAPVEGEKISDSKLCRTDIVVLNN